MAVSQQIGIEAKFDTSSFSSGLAKYLGGLGKANSETSKTANSLTATGSSVDGFGSKLGGLGGIAGGAAVAGIAALGASIAAFGAGLTVSIQQAGEFEQKMADIAAVSGQSIEEVGALKDLALELSLDEDLSTTANEAAAGFEVLLKNGVKVEDVLGGVGRGIIVAGNAMGEDFALAADVATDAMNIFGVEADEFAGVADNLTGVMVNSKFGLNDMRLALAQGGAVASSAGIEFDEFSAIIAATSSNFASGSDAGTAFKTFIQRLTAPTGKAKSEMAALGIEVFDAEGKMRNMTDIFAQFQGIADKDITEGFTIGGRTEEQEAQLVAYRKQLAGVIQETEEWNKNLSSAAVASTAEERVVQMDRLAIETANVSAEIAKLEAIEGKTLTTTRKLTDQEQQQALTTIFGADAIRFATGAMSLQEGQLEGLQAAINKEGLAQEAAATRTKTFQGALERLNSAYEFLKIQIGTPLLSPLSGFLDDTITPLIREVAALGAVFASTGLGGVAFELGFDAATIGQINEIANAFNEGLVPALLKIDEIATGGLFAQLAGSFQALIALTQESGGGGLLALLGFSPETIGLIDTFSTQLKTLFGIITSFDFEALAGFDFGSLIADAVGGSTGAQADIISSVTEFLTPLIDGFSQFVVSPEFATGVDNLTTQIANVIVAGLTTAGENLGGGFCCDNCGRGAIGDKNNSRFCGVLHGE
jgi:TP901 family phage tail tape measure protein